MTFAFFFSMTSSFLCEQARLRTKARCWQSATIREMLNPRSIAQRISFRCFVCVSLLALAAAGCGNRDGGRKIPLTDCRLPKLSTAAQCGMVEVSEDRSQTGGRNIVIAVTVLRANTL